MRRRRLKLAGLGVPALLLACAAAQAGSSAEILLPAVPDIPAASVVILRSLHPVDQVSVAAVPALAPFKVAPHLVVTEHPPLPFADVTGSIGAPAAPASAQPDATPGRADEVGPALPAVESGVAASSHPAAQGAPGAPVVLQPAELAAAIHDFLTVEPARSPGSPAAQLKQRSRDRQAIADYYAIHGNAPLWIEGDGFSPGARAALSRIDRAGEDGLSLAAYAVPALSDPTPTKLAAADLAVSEAVVAYGRQAAGGRIDPLQIDRLITAKPVVPEVADILAWISVAADPDAALQAYNPPQPGYAALRDKLAELRRDDVPVAKDSIPSGPTLKPGMRDARVPLVRARFGLDLPTAENEGGLVYDRQVVAAVTDFQRANGLPVSGLLTGKTVAALSVGNPSRLENELVANMERWRWMPRDLGAEHILVNVPDYSLDVVKDGASIHHARVVVGKPDHQTPIFSDLMRFVIVNPYWNVPLSIIKKEMMPKLADDPNYFANHGYEVVERNGVTYVRQPPGEDNALGRIKFMFPNQHAVYLHDTNARALFGKTKRAFSHGCVRVDQPFALAEVVLGPAWSEKRISKLIGGDERTINLPKPLPIHIGYFTSFVDDGGTLQLRDDVYGYSARVKLALGLRE